MPHIKGTHSKSSIRIGIVVSRFNEEMTSKLLSGALTRANEIGIPESNLTVVHVPGAVEIPIVLQRLASRGEYDALIALGAVIRGETSHYDYVCDQVSQGCQKVSLEADIPVLFGILTTENDEQALARCGGSHGNKGADCIDAACEMTSVLEQI